MAFVGRTGPHPHRVIRRPAAGATSVAGSPGARAPGDHPHRYGRIRCSNCYSRTCRHIFETDLWSAEYDRASNFENLPLGRRKKVGDFDFCGSNKPLMGRSLSWNKRTANERFTRRPTTCHQHLTPAESGVEIGALAPPCRRRTRRTTGLTGQPSRTAGPPPARRSPSGDRVSVVPPDGEGGVERQLVILPAGDSDRGVAAGVSRTWPGVDPTRSVVFDVAVESGGE